MKTVTRLSAEHCSDQVTSRTLNHFMHFHMALYLYSITNLKFWGRSEQIINKTLQLLSDLSVGYSSVRKLVKLEAVQFLLNSHTVSVSSSVLFAHHLFPFSSPLLIIVVYLNSSDALLTYLLVNTVCASSPVSAQAFV